MFDSEEIESMKFRKRPVVIEAQQLGSDDARPIVRWVTDNGGRCWTGEHVEQINGRNHYPFAGAQSVFIKTLEGDMRADPGDWVIRGVQGEFYPCKPDIFTATYEPAD